MKDKFGSRAKEISPVTDEGGRRRFLAAATTAMAATVAGDLTDLWADEGREPGSPLRPYGERSAFEKAGRKNSRPGPMSGTGSSLTPLESLYGIITPSALHYERHHSGVPLTAFLLNRNKIIEAGEIMDKERLPKVRMPNRDGFIPDARPDVAKNPARVDEKQGQKPDAR